ncbi:hypothetical protein D3H65_10110 [Paraflavitalea soli]|uniref:Uncharacterized protein n=1 Tax=Paraflavitalea soli TaxID=2315862 RepID=A0A3B7MKX4_9BACT|nr:hypothetical protein [Paraflavitalea soli]AXY74307.1 hypothetical protein D3H65_10110 [Paraflavitalea soli]
MIFKDILDAKTQQLYQEFDLLLQNSLLRQTHNGDLLLVIVNGFHHPEVHTWDNLGGQQSPYLIGPGDEGHSEILHHNFIGNYLRDAAFDQPYKDYLDLIQWTSERAAEADRLHDDEAVSIQYEMLIYQKIWEMDSYLKKLYQLTRIANSEPYDWHFRIKQSVNLKNKGKKREEIVRLHVRDRLKPEYPLIYNAIKNAYRTQVRNSIAHSQYSIYGRYIHLHNYIEDDLNSQIRVITFDQWVDMIHDTLVIYSQISRLQKMIDTFYVGLSKNSGGTVEVRINRIDPVEKVEFHLLKPVTEKGGLWCPAKDN